MCLNSYYLPFVHLSPFHLTVSYYVNVSGLNKSSRVTFIGGNYRKIKMIKKIENSISKISARSHEDQWIGRQSWMPLRRHHWRPFPFIPRLMTSILGSVSISHGCQLVRKDNRDSTWDKDLYQSCVHVLGWQMADMIIEKYIHIMTL